MASSTEFIKTTYDFLYRIVLIGDSGVGKTAILLRYSENVFSVSFITTIGIDFRIKTVEMNGKRVKLQVWDTAGQERFHSVATSYYRNAHGIMLIYDVSKAESFLHITKWVNNISKNSPTNVKLILIGNKCDIEDNMRVIERERGTMLAQELNMPFLETSAKLDLNVGTAFELLTTAIMEEGSKREEEEDVGNGTAGNLHLNRHKEDSNVKKHKCCQKSTA